MVNYREIIGDKDTDPRKRSYAVIVKNCVDCNYNCTYCYTEEVGEAASTMTIDTAKVMVRKVAEYARDRTLYFIWHGGEPLLAGLDFFYEIAKFTNSISQTKIVNCIQTNAAFINQEFVDFCKSTGFHVSTSIDGPEEIHNFTRKDKNGNGTFSKTMESVKFLQNQGIKVASVTVLHKKNVDKIEQLYTFFRDNRINFRINPVVKAGNAVTNYNELAITPFEYGKAICQLFDLWYEDEDPIQVNPLETIVGNIMDSQVWGCNYQGRCLQSIISITPEGNIYPCGRFIGNTEFLIGNILECDSLANAFNNETYKKLSSRDATTVEGCQDCQFKNICNAGCMITAHMGNGNIFDKDYYCGGRKMIFSHILDVLMKNPAYGLGEQVGVH